MIWSPRAINLWRSTSESRLIRRRYFYTSFVPEDWRWVSVAADLFDLTREIWQA
jgi:hypothetical protein